MRVHPIGTLPVKLLMRILGSLNLRDLITCLTVSRLWEEVSRTELATRRHLSLVRKLPKKEIWPGTMEAVEYILLPQHYHTKTFSLYPFTEINKNWLIELMPGIRYLHISLICTCKGLIDIIKRLAPI